MNEKKYCEMYEIPFEKQERLSDKEKLVFFSVFIFTVIIICALSYLAFIKLNSIGLMKYLYPLALLFILYRLGLFFAKGITPQQTNKGVLNAALFAITLMSMLIVMIYEFLLIVNP
jgi:hypothetical protein